MSDTLHLIISAMAVGRVVLGIAPFIAVGLSMKLLGFPAEQDSPTARLMARFFGVRDIGLGVLVFYALRHLEIMPFAMLFNAGMDGGDLVSALIPIVRRQGIDRAAIGSGIMAGSAGIAWLIMWKMVT